jgi:hypothetical protein
MKKYLILIAYLLFLGGKGAFAQEVVPNGDFENWDGINPEGWIGLFNSDDFQNVFQSGDAQSGSYSAELRVVYHPLLMNYVRSGMFVETNFPVSSKPEALNGYYKGAAAGGDTLTVVVGMFNNSNPIGFGFFYSTQSVSNWTSFSVPITYTGIDNPDQGFISINAGQFFASTDGTDYFVDNLTFSGPAGISDKIITSNFTLFPNPAEELLNIRFTLANSDNIEFELINLQGVAVPVSKKVTFQPGTNDYQISISSFPSGIYFLKANGDNSQFIEKITIKQY